MDSAAVGAHRVKVTGTLTCEWEEVWTGDYIFENEWQSSQTKKDGKEKRGNGYGCSCLDTVGTYRNVLPVPCGAGNSGPPLQPMCRKRAGDNATESGTIAPRQCGIR